METQLLSEKYADALDGVLNCYDRMVVIGQVPLLCYAKGMTKYLYSQSIRVFDYTQFAKPLSDQIRANAEALAQANGP